MSLNSRERRRLARKKLSAEARRLIERAQLAGMTPAEIAEGIEELGKPGGVRQAIEILIARGYVQTADGLPLPEDPDALFDLILPKGPQA